jgi:hypothetical protein
MFRHITITTALVAAFALTGCGTAVSPVSTPGTQAAKSAITAKKPGNETLVVKDAIRTQLEREGQITKVRKLDVVPGPTIMIYPPVKPTVFDFTAEIEQFRNDDAVYQFVVKGTYSTVTQKMTVNSKQAVVF